MGQAWRWAQQRGGRLLRAPATPARKPRRLTATLAPPLTHPTHSFLSVYMRSECAKACGNCLPDAPNAPPPASAVPPPPRPDCEMAPDSGIACAFFLQSLPNPCGAAAGDAWIANYTRRAGGGGLGPAACCKDRRAWLLQLQPTPPPALQCQRSRQPLLPTLPQPFPPTVQHRVPDLLRHLR